MSGAGLIELLAARLAGRGARSAAAPTLREAIATMPTRIAGEPNPIMLRISDLPERGVDQAKVRQYGDMLSTSEPPPILVARRPGGSWEIMDGEHRAAAMRQAGRQEVPAIDISERVGWGAQEAPPTAPSLRNALAEVNANRARPDAGGGQAGRQTREIPIDQAMEASGSPFTDDVWEIGGPQITVEEVRAAMARGARRENSFSHQSDLDWTRQDHIDRMATLARDGWSEPLELTPYGINDDGLHRLGAAIARGDQRIRVNQRQLSAAEQRELTADPRQLEAEYRARTQPDGGPVREGPNAGNALQRALRDRMGE